MGSQFQIDDFFVLQVYKKNSSDGITIKRCKWDTKVFFGTASTDGKNSAMLG